MLENDKLQKRLKRTTTALEEAEKLLETKSHELYTLNQSLEEKVIQRTQDLEKARNSAIEANAQKDRLIADVSHELRTPLNGIVGMVSLLSKTDLNEKQKDFVRVIEKSSGLLMSLINDILDHAKLSSGETKLDDVDFNLLKLVKNVSELFEHQASEKGLVFSIKLSESLPKFIRSDKRKISQILINLLNNAIKFTETGSVNLKVESSNLDKKGFHSISFSVIDTGIGIPISKTQSVFKPFAQADKSDSRKYGGTGLGLSIVKSFVELLNGEVSFTSKENKGSIFTVKIEVKAAKSEFEELEKKAFETSVSEISKNSAYSVLIVEDNLVNQKITKLMLQNSGFKVSVASDGTEAIKSAKKHFYDLILMDYNMPKLNGIEATKGIRKLQLGDHKTSFINGLTANALDEAKNEAYNSGMDDYITKPVDEKTLIETIKKYLK